MTGSASHPRLWRLPTTIALGLRVPVAVDLRSRMLGLALLERDAAGAGLLIPACGSVHTLGMRFALDIFFLDRFGRLLCARHEVGPFRVVSERAAAAVLEVPAEPGGEFPRGRG